MCRELLTIVRWTFLRTDRVSPPISLLAINLIPSYFSGSFNVKYANQVEKYSTDGRTDWLTEEPTMDPLMFIVHHTHSMMIRRPSVQ